MWERLGMSVSLTCNKRVFEVGRRVFHSNTTHTSYKRSVAWTAERDPDRKHCLPVRTEERDRAVDGGLKGREESGGSQASSALSRSVTVKAQKELGSSGWVISVFWLLRYF